MKAQHETIGIVAHIFDVKSMGDDLVNESTMKIASQMKLQEKLTKML